MKHDVDNATILVKRYRLSLIFLSKIFISHNVWEKRARETNVKEKIIVFTCADINLYVNKKDARF
jgi:hypothetical protein